MAETAQTSSSSRPASRDAAVTRTLLACGVVAGPIYVALGLIQMLIRDGFDIRRHPLSLLSNGELGWIQIANFLLSGLLVVACAIGMRRVLHSGRGRTWGPLLVGTYGVAVATAGVFRADPVDGFPPGTPLGPPTEVSVPGMLHFMIGAVGFMALIVACLVFARRFSASGERTWAVYSAATGILFFAGFAGLLAGGGGAFLNVTFAVTIVIAWAWVSAVAVWHATESHMTQRGRVEGAR